MRKKKSIIGLIAVAGLAAAKGAPLATGVSVFKTEAEGIVVSYNLSEDAIVTADFMTNGVSVGVVEVGGDVNKVVSSGERRITWRPDRSPDHSRVMAADEVGVKLTVWPKTNPPDWMVVDLMVKNVLQFYATSNDVPGGVGSRQYKTTKLLMRRIPAAGVEWRMGKENYNYGYDHYVKLSSDYYMCVYQLTLRQAYCINKTSTSTFSDVVDDYWVLPLEGISWRTMRGGADWPADGHTVGDGCLIDGFRKWTGLELDLPTSAQWEFAARAGTSGEVWWGADVSDAKVKGMANCASAVGHPVEVGSYPPNPWGLYDMYGNIIEECLDYCCFGSVYQGLYGNAPTVAVSDPEGPSSGECNVTVATGERVRVGRGGGFSDATSSMRSHSVTGANVHEYKESNRWIGYRLVCPLPWR